MIFSAASEKKKTCREPQTERKLINEAIVIYTLRPASAGRNEKKKNEEEHGKKNEPVVKIINRRRTQAVRLCLTSRGRTHTRPRDKYSPDAESTESTRISGGAEAIDTPAVRRGGTAILGIGERARAPWY